MMELKRICFFILFFTSSYNGFSQPQRAPKLIVGVVVDQMCYDYLYRYYDRFSKRGFRMMMNNGLNCRNTQYNYIPTYTGPGHASIYTGTTPNNHGIVGNDWYDRILQSTINCVDDNSVKSVGADSQDGLCSPRNYKTHTIGDQLRLTWKESKVISLSIKDRGAILPGGHLSNGSYWFDYQSGKFITSSFYRSNLPDWLQEFNSRNVVANAMNQKWETLYDISTYDRSLADASSYERILPGKSSATFPYDLTALKETVPMNRLFTLTPFANTALTDCALSGLQGEHLGEDNVPDMLCISYSTPDIAGHTFGPYSVEIEDMYLRLDLEIARLLESLEKKLGKDNFLLFLTADHAVVPVPQQLIDLQLPGGYFATETRIKDLDSLLRKRYGADVLLAETNLNVYLDHQVIDSLGLPLPTVQREVAKIIEKWEHVKAAYPAVDLGNTSSDDEWRDMMRRGYHREESGDVLFMLEPGYIPVDTDIPEEHVGTTHGSAFNYDTHVPLLWYGWNIKPGDIHHRIQITDIAATLAHVLNIQRNGAMTGQPILELLRRK
jgi:hypothetical protein